MHQNAILLLFQGGHKQLKPYRNCDDPTRKSTKFRKKLRNFLHTFPIYFSPACTLNEKEKLTEHKVTSSYNFNLKFSQPGISPAHISLIHPSCHLCLLLLAPLVLLADLLLLRRREVVLDVERLADLLGGLALDHVGHGLASDVEEALDV